MRRYLVTGGAGFVGSHIATALVERGDGVRILDDLSTGLIDNIGHLEHGSPQSGAPCEFIRGSVSDGAACAAACHGIDGVFHEAAQVSVPRSVEDPVASYEINVMGTLRLLRAAQQAGVPRFVFASSSAVYGSSKELPKVETMPVDPASPYASSKAAGEHLLRVYGQLHGMRTVSLRYFNIFGPRQRDDSPYTGVIALFARALLDGARVRIDGDGEQSRDFTYIGNVVQANLLAMESDVEPGLAVNVGVGERTSINQLHAALAELLGKQPVADHVDSRVGDVKHSLACLERARTSLGYSPDVDFKTGLARTLDWYAAGRL
jgi:UDP-glucose 4-epimerase